MLDLEEISSGTPIKRVYLLSGEMLDYYWNDIIAGLKDCPGYFDYYTPEWTYEQVKTGHLLVWSLSDGSIRGIVLTRVLIFPKQRVFHILAIYGMDMLDFFSEMEDVFMKIAQDFQCQTISALCRPGLKRLLKNFRAEEESITLRREVPRIGVQ